MAPQASPQDSAQRESAAYDVLVVGAGPAGLATAIRLKQRAAHSGRDVSVCVLEKAEAPGAHTLSGAIMDPRALTELFEDWKQRGAPLTQPVTHDQFLFLGKRAALRTPHFLLPECFQNVGNYVVSLGAVVRWLAQQAESLGVEAFFGYSGRNVIYGKGGSVQGVVTQDVGVGRDGRPTTQFQAGMELRAKYTIFAEGSRGHLGRELIKKYQLDEHADPQSYALGLKELWRVPPGNHLPGHVVHTAGWPLDATTYGGGFLYHGEDHTISVGFVLGLDYRNPWLSPFEELQRFKTHPSIRKHLEGGERIGYGARTITAGGLESLPRLVFPGGALVGCEAGTLNASRIKGSHAAIKTGMLAADAVFDALTAGRSGDVLEAYPTAFQESWLHAELKRSRNFKQWFKRGTPVATLMTGVEQWLLPRLGVGAPPWTLHHTMPDHKALEDADSHARIVYPRPDGVLTFDRLSSVYLSGTHHEEGQPVHLLIADKDIPIKLNLARFAGPESRYCPAGVYEFLETAGTDPKLQINASNCIHCKTCDIKDPSQNITWVPPEGGGPGYAGM